MKRIVLILVLIAVLVGGFFIVRAVTAQNNTNANSNLQTVALSRGGLTATVGATGVVHSSQSAILSWKTTGTVEQVNVEEGDFVEEGEIMASLTQNTLPQNVILAQSELIEAQNTLDDLLVSRSNLANASRTLAQAQLALIEAERTMNTYEEQEYEDELETAREAVVDARDELDQAEEDFEPYQDWDEDNSTRQAAEDRLEDAQDTYEEAIRRLNELETQKEIASAELQTAQAALEDAQREYDRLKDGPDPDDVAVLETRIAAAQATLDSVTLTAPFSGTVTMVDLNAGDQVSMGQVAFQLDDLSELLVDVPVSEVDINRISIGQPASMTFDAIQNQEYHGIVSQVAMVGTENQGVVDFIVTLELTDADEKVKPGMTSAVSVVVNELENVLLVPNRAVRVVEGQRVVYLLKNGELTPTEVTLGSSSDTMSEVVEGDIQAGDTLVLNPPTDLFSGPPPFVQR